MEEPQGAVLAITSLGSLDEAQRAAVAASVRAGDYNLFLGAGVSLDSSGGTTNTFQVAGSFKRLCARPPGFPAIPRYSGHSPLCRMTKLKR